MSVKKVIAACAAAVLAAASFSSCVGKGSGKSAGGVKNFVFFFI